MQTLSKEKKEKVIKALNILIEYELAGVVAYTHYSLMINGPYRIPIVEFLKSQAIESLAHAQKAGEILTGLGGHPSLEIAKIKESNQHSWEKILEESLKHERKVTTLYQALLKEVKETSIYLEEFAREMIKQEELHSIELEKMLRDYA